MVSYIQFFSAFTGLLNLKIIQLFLSTFKSLFNWSVLVIS